METNRTGPRRVASSVSSVSYVSQKVDPQAMIDHSVKLQNWICEKALRSIQNKANQEIKQSNEVVDEIMERENTFVREVSDMLENKEMHDKRRKQQLSRRWNRIVFAPMNDKIRNVMDGEGLANLQRRKRELHQEYIDIVNRRGPASLDVYSEGDYYPFGLHGTRPSHLKVHTRNLTDDPTIIHERQQNSEHRVVLRCETGVSYGDKDLELIRLPPLPLVPQGRHGTTCKTWEYMPYHDVDSEIRLRSRQRMRPDFNFSQVSLTHPRKERLSKSAPQITMATA